MKIKFLFICLLAFFSKKINAQFLCNASFTYSSNPNGVVVFTATGNSNSPAANYYWMFGNGASGFGQTATAVYNSNGTYTACLIVMDSLYNCADTVCQTITIGSILPCSGTPSAGTAVASNYTPPVGGNVTYSLSGATASAGITYQWQRAINSTAPFYNIGGATNSTYSENCYSDYCFRCILTCTNSSMSDTSTIACTMPSTTTLPCNANFQYTLGTNGVVTFNSNSTNVNSGTNYTWSYNNSPFGYGTSSTYQFSANGTYTICLHIADSLNTCSDDTCLTVTVNNVNTLPCNAAYSYSFNPAGGLVLTSTGSSSSTMTYSWFSNGTPVANGQSATLSLVNGNYNICLVIHDSASNCVDSACQTITVANSLPCQANYYIYPDSLGAPHTYIGVNTSTGTGLSYVWTWGDGTSSTGAYPSHTYASAGNYQICLTVSSSNCVDSFCAPQGILKGTAMYTVNFAAPSAIKNVTNDIASIYPNPTNGNITIKGLANATYQVELLNLNGSVINKYSVTNSQNINIATLKPAVYILKISDDKGNHQYTKLIKE